MSLRSESKEIFHKLTKKHVSVNKDSYLTLLNFSMFKRNSEELSVDMIKKPDKDWLDIENLRVGEFQ